MCANIRSTFRFYIFNYIAYHKYKTKNSTCYQGHTTISSSSTRNKKFFIHTIGIYSKMKMIRIIIIKKKVKFMISCKNLTLLYSRNDCL